MTKGSYICVEKPILKLNGLFTLIVIGTIIFLIAYWLLTSGYINGICGKLIQQSIQKNGNTDVTNVTFVTAKGNLSGAQLETEIFSPFGYFYTGGIQHNIPIIERKEKQMCDQVFGNWIQVAENDTSGGAIEPLKPDKVPSKIFTLNGYSHVLDCYMNDSYNNNNDAVNNISRHRFWDKKSIEEITEKAREDIHTAMSGVIPYEDAMSVFYSTKFYNISEKIGAVIGSLTPWVEILCLVNNAKHIVTVDYQKISTSHPKITFAQAHDLAKDHLIYENTFDFIVSFSSVEHSGLGRYGDPTDPFGDVKEIQKIRCLLKPGGLLFLGLPVGADILGNNCHRIYGQLRLPFMFEGFDLLNTFSTEERPFDIRSEQLRVPLQEIAVQHYTFVLRKKVE